MLCSYFVVARCSGNIIRVIRRSSPPADSATVTNVYAACSSLHHYETLYESGQDLISLTSVSQGWAA